MTEAAAAAGEAPGAAAAALGFGGSGASSTSWRVVVGSGGGVESMERRCWCLESWREEAAAEAAERQALLFGVKSFLLLLSRFREREREERGFFRMKREARRRGISP